MHLSSKECEVYFKGSEGVILLPWILLATLRIWPVSIKLTAMYLIKTLALNYMSSSLTGLYHELYFIPTVMSVNSF